MFSIQQSDTGVTRLVEQKGMDNLVTVEILPHCGGLLHSFSILHNGIAVNVIDGYENPDDFKENVTSKGFKSCKLSPFACRIKDATYTFENKSYTTDKFLLGNNALHGLLYDANFEVTAVAASEDEATVTMKYNYTGNAKGYPFNFDCFITYTLEPGNELTLTTEVVNTGTTNMPVQDGWHPYFTLGKKIDSLELTLHSKDQVICDKEIIPTGELKSYKAFSTGKKIGDTFFDDCFLLEDAIEGPACVLTDKENKIQVAIRPGKGYPYLQLYTPDHRNSIAIENLSAPPDCFNNGVNLIVLKPGESTKFATTYVITSFK